MSTPPPPFPPRGPSSPTFQYDRATINAQRRAAARQAKLQREHMRLQARAARRSSIVGPLFLLTFGVVLLVLQTGHWQWHDALYWLSRWWPLVLILAGVILLAEYCWDRTHPTAINGFPVRRSLGGGTAFLLILLTLLGIASSVAEHGSDWAQQNLDKNLDFGDVSKWPQFLGSRSEYTSTLDAPLATGGTLTIVNPHGDVSVVGSSQDGRVHVSTRQHVFAWHSDDTETRRNEERPHLTGDSHSLTLSAAMRDTDDADLTVQIPHEAALTIRSDHGDVNIEELRGAVNLSTKSGNVKLTALRGPVHLSAADDDAEVNVHSLDGELTIQGRTGDLNLSDINGPLSLQGDFFGTTHLERVHGVVHFKSSFTDFSCNGLPGDLNIEGRSDLDARQVEGPVILTTTNRNITLDDLRGAAKINDRNGSVHLGLLNPLQAVDITNQNGSVELAVPGGSKFTLDATTQNGDIHNDLGLHAVKTGEVSRLNTAVGGGGSSVHLQTSEGDIELQHIAHAEKAEDWDEDGGTHITPAPSRVKKAAPSDTD